MARATSPRQTDPVRPRTRSWTGRAVGRVVGLILLVSLLAACLTRTAPPVKQLLSMSMVPPCPLLPQTLPPGASATVDPSTPEVTLPGAPTVTIQFLVQAFASLPTSGSAVVDLTSGANPVEALRLRDASARFDMTATSRLVLVCDEVQGPYTLQIDGIEQQVDHIADLDGFPLAGARIYAYVDPQDPARAGLVAAGSFFQLGLGGVDLLIEGVCQSPEDCGDPVDPSLSPTSVLKPAFRNGRGSRLFDGVVATEVELTGQVDRILQQITVEGLELPGGVLPVRLYEVGSSGAPLAAGNAQVLAVPGSSRQSAIWFPASSVLLEPGKRYRVAAWFAETPAGSFRYDYDWVEQDRFPFPDSSGLFEVTGSFRADTDVYPTQPASTTTDPSARRFPKISIVTRCP